MGIGLALVVVTVVRHPLGDSGGHIDKGKPCRPSGDVFDQAVFERHADAKEEPCPAKLNHLARRRLEGVRVLSRLDEYFDIDAGAADTLDQVGNRRDAGEDP